MYHLGIAIKCNYQENQWNDSGKIQVHLSNGGQGCRKGAIREGHSGPLSSGNILLPTQNGRHIDAYFIFPL